jgi:hypothetical protein
MQGVIHFLTSDLSGGHGKIMIVPKDEDELTGMKCDKYFQGGNQMDGVNMGVRTRLKCAYPQRIR